MPFQLSLERAWTRGSVLAGPEDLVPQGALRLLENMRLDREPGTLTTRPGLVQQTGTPLAGAIRMLSLLQTPNGTFYYAQAGTTLTRLNASWVGATVLLNTPDVILAETNHINGETTPWKFFVGGGLALKHDGAALHTFGLAAPSAAPQSVTPGSALSQQISSMDTLTGWGNFDTTLFALDGAIKQEGSNAITFGVAANTVGGIALGMSQAVPTHTGANGSQVLEDASLDFLALGVHRGALVTNITDGNWSVFVSRVDQHTLYFVPADLGAHVFDNGDQCTISWNLETLWPVVTTGVDQGPAGPARTTSIIDWSKDFSRLGVTAGMVVENLTTGAYGVITSIGKTFNEHDTLHCTGGFVGGTGPFIVPGDAYEVVNRLVDPDDWMQLQVRVDNTEYLEFLQLDFDLAASQYTSDFQSVRVNPAQLNQGTNQWTRLRLRKSAFQRYGTSFRDWQIVTGVRLVVQASVHHAVQVWVDDLRLVGGYGLEGEVEYAAIYANENTGGMSAPAKTEDQVLIATRPVTVARQPVTVNVTNLAGPSFPQVTHLWLYRRTQASADFQFVASLPLGTLTFVDDRSELQLDTTRQLELDNDPPPADLDVIFGPGALQRLFGIRERNKVRFPKSWERHRFRSEHWPEDFEFQIGDGSEVALNGLVMDQVIFIWTDRATWAVQGQGPDAFVPFPVPLSRGLAARYALTYGDTHIFFLASDGIYEQNGVNQMLLTEDIAPFFHGQMVHGVAPLNRAAIGTCRLAWKPHPTDPLLVLLYPDEGAQAPNKRLMLKKNRQTGRYTTCAFDRSSGLEMRSSLVDLQSGQLYYGSLGGHVYEAEVEQVESDAGVAIPWRVRTGARDDGASRLVKTYSDVVLQMQTHGQVVSVRALFDHSTSEEALGTVTTMAANGLVELPLTQPASAATARRHMLAVELTGATTQRVTIYGIGWHVEGEAEDLTFVDSGHVTMPLVHALKSLALDVDAPADLAVAVWVENVQRSTLRLPATTGRVRLHVLLPAGLKGKVFRVTCTSTAFFQLYSLEGWLKPWGTAIGYLAQPWLLGRARSG